VLLLARLARTDLRNRFAGSFLGVGWAFAQPAVTILLYVFIYRVAFRAPTPAGVPFASWLIVGLAPWFFFSESLLLSAGALLEYSFLVKKFRFPVAMIPAIRVTSLASVHAAVWTLVALVVCFGGVRPSLGWLAVPYYFGATLAFGGGLAVLLASVTPFVRDLQHALGTALQFAFWLTPVIWPIDAAPPRAARLLALNPLEYVVSGVRGAMLHQGSPFASPARAAYFWGATLTVHALAWFTFRKLRPHFADVV
jgi:teichoic acid transport system permease protein